MSGLFGEEKRPRGSGSRRLPTWLVVAAGLALTVVCAVAAERLDQYALDRARAEGVLNRVSGGLKAQGILEYEALAEGAVSPGISERIRETRIETRAALGELEGLSRGGSARIAEGLRAYEEAVDEELRLVNAGHLREAEAFDEERVDPRFRALDGAISELRDEYASTARSADRMVDAATAAVILLAVALGTALFLSYEKALRARQNELKESEERFRALVRNSSDIITVLDADGTLRYGSPAARKLLGYDPEEKVGEKAFDYIHPEDVEKAIPALAEVLEKGEAAVELRFRHADGSWRLLEAVGSFLPDDPVVRGIVVTSRDITERRRIEEKLRESEEKYRRLVETVQEGIGFVDAEERVTYCNRAYAGVFGLTPGELVGKSLFEFLDDEQRRKALEQTVMRKRGVSSSYEISVTTADGERKDLFASGAPVVDKDGNFQGAVHAVVDVTERKRTERDLRVRDRAIASSRNGVIITGTKTRGDNPLVYANPAFERMTGYATGEMLGRDCRFLQGDDRDQPGLEELRAAVREGRECVVVLRNYRKDGALFYNEINIAPVRDENGTIINFVGMMIDVTGRMEAEEKLREANRRLGELADLRADITAMVAHEFGSPLATIRGFVDVLATGELGPAEGAGVLDKVGAEAEKLSILVGDLRSAAAIERGEFSLMPRRVRVEDMFEDAARFAETLPGHHPRAVEVATEERVWADEYRVGQVLRNLISNAAKYSPDGAPIELRAVCGETLGRVRVEVADRGHGVHPDDAERIFEKFGRGRDEDGKKAYGTGLGLYLSRRIVRAHGGELSYRPNPGGGSVFFFELEAL